jgi:hypothetical protein
MNMTHMDSGGLATDLNERPDTTQGGAAAVRDQAQEAAGTAAEEGKRVASVAGDEAQKVVAETKQQAQDLLQEARGLLSEQASTQRDRLVDVLGSMGDDLDRMGSEAQSGLAGDLVHKAAEQVRGLSGRIDGREPTDLLEDLRRFARQRPGTFLAGSLVAGLVAGRLARGAQRAHQEAPSTPGVPAQRSAGTTAPAAPVAPAPVAPTAAAPATPQAPALADFPADAPGDFR